MFHKLQRYHIKRYAPRQSLVKGERLVRSEANPVFEAQVRLAAVFYTCDPSSLHYGFAWGQKGKTDTTPRDSRVVPHPSTKRAHWSLTSEFGMGSGVLSRVWSYPPKRVAGFYLKARGPCTVQPGVYIGISHPFSILLWCLQYNA